MPRGFRLGFTVRNYVRRSEDHESADVAHDRRSLRNRLIWERGLRGSMEHGWSERPSQRGLLFTCVDFDVGDERKEVVCAPYAARARTKLITET